MAILRCKMCGGDLIVDQDDSVLYCSYCGTQQTVPKLKSEQTANLYTRANHFRRSNDYDRAIDIYNQILNENPEDAEAYWSLVLCRYGIEYVEDPETQRMKPTVNRTQNASVFADEDYKSALQYADAKQKAVYEREAGEIDEIQKKILNISQYEKPYDVFISYKESDENNNRTNDSVLACDIYYRLTNEGMRVFLARISLEDKLGQAYEPYIYAALKSARVMVVLGTKTEYFNSAWVKNEWSRFLGMMNEDSKKTLIPVYKDMDPYDLPREFSRLQALDIGRLGFVQDLVHGIEKIVEKEPKNSQKSVSVNSGQATINYNFGFNKVNLEPLLRRAELSLETGEFDAAMNVCENILNNDPENAMAYVYRLMAICRVTKMEDLGNLEDSFDNQTDYRMAYRFADDNLKAQLDRYAAMANSDTDGKTYRKAEKLMNSAREDYEFINAARMFQTILDYQDAAALAEQCNKMAYELHYADVHRAYQSGNCAACMEACERLLVNIPNDGEAMLYKALCLMKASSKAMNRTAEAVHLAILAEGTGIARKYLGDTFLPVFDETMKRICDEQLQYIQKTPRKERPVLCIRSTHEIMALFMDVGERFTGASYNVYAKSMQNCELMIRQLSPFAHDAAKQFNQNRPYSYGYRAGIKYVTR